MPQFSPDQVTFGDPTGYGAWDLGHAREHLQFVQSLAALTPPVLLANYDFLSLLNAGAARKSQIETHAQAHTLLGQIVGVTSSDFGGYNLDSPDDFATFLGAHATTHAQIRQALGIV